MVHVPRAVPSERRPRARGRTSGARQAPTDEFRSRGRSHMATGVTPLANPQQEPAPRSQPVIVLGGCIDAADIPALCAHVERILGSATGFTLECRVETIAVDATTLDALARMVLTCRRLGRRLELRGASVRLEELVLFAGLIEVLPCLPAGGTGPPWRRIPVGRTAGSALQVERQAE
jgi:ABC-type transporter Mla MlaB component